MWLSCLRTCTYLQTQGARKNVSRNSPTPQRAIRAVEITNVPQHSAERRCSSITNAIRARALIRMWSRWCRLIRFRLWSREISCCWSEQSQRASQSVSGVESLHSALVKQEILQKGQDFPPSRRTFTPACNYAYGFTSNFIVRDFKWHVDGIIVGFVSFRRLTFFRAILALVMWYVCKSFFAHLRGLFLLTLTVVI